MIFPPAPEGLHLPELEERVQARWRRRELPKRVARNREGARPWIFYEGPPTANGRPGVHHVWARAFKDLYPRFRTMQGYRVPRKGGWDCHGLPVELEVEKELGLRSKQDIEQYGIVDFNARCRQSVQRYVDDWTALTERAGIWIDSDDAYWTLSNAYVESVWWLLTELWNHGLLYEGHRVSPYCARCGTALSSHELGQPDVYRDVVDPSVYVRFPLNDDDAVTAGADLLVWTTTPWTLVSNVAAAVGPDIPYVRVPSTVFGVEGRDLIVAAARLPEGGEAAVTARMSGHDLIGRHYRRPYGFMSVDGGRAKSAWRVVPADFVSTDEGSGIIHLAPAFGEEDAQIGRAENLPMLNPVNARGAFEDCVTPWAGLFVKDADLPIIKDLTSRGLLVSHVPYEHSYPHCWRCQTPLIYWAKTSWFVRTAEKRDLLVRENEQIGWNPELIKRGRFGNWLAENVDWALSRDRYWGTPLPIWRCEDCGSDMCVGSVAQLSELADRDLSELDLHRPFVDEVEIRCPSCGGRARRLPPVVDAWFDSGGMPSAQFHHPFENSALFERSFPADFICEGIDQTRGWFYSLLAVNALVFGRSPYRNVVCLGLVVDEQGQKMSKSRGNVIDPWSIFDGQGADALRWYFFSQGQPWTPRRISPEGIRDSARQTLFTLWNVYSFFITYAGLEGWEPSSPDRPAPSPTHVLDRWILSELDDTVTVVTASLEAFDSYTAAGRLALFVDDLSNWYVRRSRARFWRSSDALSHSTLYECLVTTSLLLAPFCPMLADEIMVNLTSASSVHLADWPEPHGRHDPEFAEAMRAARRLVALGRAARTDARMKVRQPLARAMILHPGPDLGDEITDEIRAELNVKSLEHIETISEVMSWRLSPNFRRLGPRLGPKMEQVRLQLLQADGAALKALLDAEGFVEVAGERLEREDVELRAVRHEGFALASDDGGWAVALDLDVTPELRAEGTARDLIRALNELRKTSGLGIAERIEVNLELSDQLRLAIQPHLDWVAEEVLATTVDFTDGDVEFTLDGETARATLRRL